MNGERPIWKDTYYVNALNTLQYNIEDNTSGNVIFSGKAYKLPGAANLKINVAPICANYINSDIVSAFWAQTGHGYWQFDNAIKTFDLMDNVGNYLTSYTFINDYSYVSTTSNTFSFPITGKWAPNMYYFETYYQNNQQALKLYFSKDEFPAAASATTVTMGCGDYALYYQNMRMGWDSFLIEGKVVRTDDFQFSEYTKTIDNSTPYQRGSTRYQNQIQPKWELHTGWLKDSQAAILAEHLLSSNQVWLHNLKTDEIIPVSITDSNAEYKKYLSGSKGKRISYTINVKAANKKVKR